MNGFSREVPNLEVSRNGIRKLHKCISDLADGKLKVRLRNETIKVIDQLLDEFRVPLFNGTCTDIFSAEDFIRLMFEESVKELDENVSKRDKAAGVVKTGCFDICLRIVKEFCEDSNAHLLEEQGGAVITILLKFLGHDFVQTKSWMEESVSEALIRLLSAVDLKGLEGEYHIKLWKYVWLHLSRAITTNSACGSNFLCIVLVLLRVVPTTVLALDGTSLIVTAIQTLFQAFDKADMKRWNKKMSKSALDVLCCLLDQWGVECRSELLSRIWTFSLHFCGGKRLTIDPADADGIDSLWRFIDLLTILAVPDCNKHGLVDERIYEVASVSLQGMASSLLRLSKTRPSFLICADHASVFAKLLVISEFCNDNRACFNQNLTQSGYSQHAKRRKEMTVFEILTTWKDDDGVASSFLSCSLVILREMVCSYSHRLGVETLTTLAATIWNQRALIIDSQRATFCSLLDALLVADAYGTSSNVKAEANNPNANPMQDPRVRIKAMWQFAIHSSNIPACVDESSTLVLTLLRNFQKVLGDEQDLIGVMCSFVKKENSSLVLPILSHVLSNMEFDELQSFMSVEGRCTGIVKWRFRCQLSEWLLTNVHRDLSTILFQLCCYHPTLVNDDNDTLAKCSDDWHLEDDIKLLCTPATMPRSREPVGMRVSVAEMIDYITHVLQDNLSSECRPSLWQTAIRFLMLMKGEGDSGAVVFSTEIIDALNGLRQSVEDRFVEVLSSGSTDSLALLDPGAAACMLSCDARRMTLQYAPDFPALYARFQDTSVATEIPPRCFIAYMDEVLVQSSERLGNQVWHQIVGEHVEHFAACTDFLPDLLLVLRKYGRVIPLPSFNAVLNRARTVVQEDVDSGSLSELEQQLARLQIGEAALCSSGTLRWGDAPELNECLELSLMHCLRHISHITLESASALKCVQRSKAHPLILQYIASLILSDYRLWQTHFTVIQVMISEKDTYQAFEEYIANLTEHTQFYCLDLAVTDVSCDLSFAFNRRLNELKASEVVSILREDNSVHASGFPDVLTLAERYWPTVSDCFWRLYDTNSHHLLSSLRAQVEISSKLGLEARFLSFLELLCQPFAGKKLQERFRRPFVLTVKTIMVALTESVLKRYQYRGSSSQHTVYLAGLVSVSNHLGAERDQLFARLSDLYKSSQINDTNLLYLFEQNSKQNTEAEASDFLRTGTVKNVEVFSLASFWETVRQLMITEKSAFNYNTKDGIRLYDSILFAWDTLPRLRPFISALLCFFEQSLTEPIQGTQCSERSLVEFMHRYCFLKIVDHRLTDSVLFECCLRVLSIDVFGEQTILRVSKKQVQHIRSPASSLAQQLCNGLIGIALEKVTNDNLLSVLRLAQNMIPLDPTMANLLASHVSSLEEVKQDAASYLLKFTRTHLENMENVVDARIVRTLCECVDGVGLHVMATIDCTGDDLILLATLAHRAQYYKHAFAIANLAFDRVTVDHRALLAFGGEAPENRQLTGLLRDIYIGTENAAALDSLPDWAQCDSRVQQLRAVLNNRWMRVASDSTSSEERITMARWYCGLTGPLPSRETTYMDAILRSNWNSSYPKRCSSQWDRLYSMLISSSGSPERSEDIRFTLRSSIERDLSSCEQISSLKCRWLHDLHALEQFRSGSLSVEKLSVNQLCVLISEGFLLADSLRPSDVGPNEDFYSQHTRTVVTLIRRLLQKEAYSACLALLSAWTSLHPPDYPTHSLLVEKSRVLVAMGDHQIAHYHLDQLRHTGQAVDTCVAVEAMVLLADIAADHDRTLDVAIDIMQTLASSLPENTPSHILVAAYQKFHSLAVRQLLEIEAFLDSSVNKTRKEAVAQWNNQLRGMSTADTNQITLVKRELRCEQLELNSTSHKLDEAVSLAVMSGLRLLSNADQSSGSNPYEPFSANREATIRILFPLLDVVFRYQDDARMVDYLRRYVVDMDPWVWVPAVPHIISHCFKEGTLSKVIQDIIVKMIVAYPYHVVHTVLAYKQDSDKRTRVKSLLSAAIRAAQDQRGLEKVITTMSMAHKIYQNFARLNVNDTAYFTASAQRKDKFTILDTVELVKHLETLRTLPLPTIEQKLTAAGDYSTTHLVLWEDIARPCEKADGKSAPIIITVKGSDGRIYKMVWKNGEDVRQDCMVEHLFEIMSCLLESGQPLRTYHVVPLDRSSGIIEFCANTTSLKELLVGSRLNGGLHKSVYPKEDVYRCRTKIFDINRTRHLSHDEFVSALKAVTPAFRHHFYRSYPTVQEWSRMIESYTLSLAQWSIVCYVVGLGDRHASNVLFEPKTCNFVHIDLGMILEFSKRVLPIPEKVPFRMTRDLLDPILIQGIRGNLAHQASATMEKLRNNKEVILGVASVFLRESMTNFRDFTDASRPSYVSTIAIDRLRSKLNGTDSSISSVTSDVQVARLLKEATDLDHLSKIFIGWLSIV